jgi:hypothetical protein
MCFAANPRTVGAPNITTCVWSAVLSALDQRLFVVDTHPSGGGQAHVFGVAQAANPQKLFLERAKECSMQPLPSCTSTQAGLDSIPKKANSLWNRSLMYRLP